MVADTLSDEEGRLGALRRYGLPGSGAPGALDYILNVARSATGAPMASLSVLDRTTEIVLAGNGVPHLIDRTDSLAALVVGNRAPLAIPDTLAQESAGNALCDAGMRAYLGVPLQTADGHIIGVLAIMDTRPRQFTADEMAIALDLARLAMSHFASLQHRETDSLTGAFTRHRFQAEVEREFVRATRYERPAALMFFDIDRFSDVNIALGPQMAEEVLKSVANRAAESLRSTDTFGRIAGEEFGILLPETMAYEASQCAERLREEIARLRFRHAGGVLSVTASFGIAPLAPGLRSAIHWFAQADIGLYGAKQAGSNCVVFAPPADPGVSSSAAQPAEPLASRVH
jgi:diguanylate cyclase (GGDEF)-like protein